MKFKVGNVVEYKQIGQEHPIIYVITTIKKNDRGNFRYYWATLDNLQKSKSVEFAKNSRIYNESKVIAKELTPLVEILYK